MLDKFLNKINGSSNNNTSVSQKVEDYNSKVIEEKKRVIPSPVNWDNVQLPERYVENRFNSFQNIPRGFSQKFNKFGKNQSRFLPRPNTYKVPYKKNYDNDFQPHNYQSEQTQQFQRREYIDDGSYFCSYAIGGNTLVCYKNKEKIEFLLEGIFHPDKNNYLAKRANYFLNDLVKKQKVYIEPTENGTYNIFLDSQKENCVNTILINEGYHNSEPYNAESKDKKTSFSRYKSSESKNTSENVEEENTDKTVIKEKKNYAYGLFATNHNTFEALFNKDKITLKIDNLDNISKEHKNICKSMIYDFVSKKSIILKFLREENGIHYVEVYNKEGICLNQMIADKNFPTISEEKTENTKEILAVEQKMKTSSSEENEQCSENDWDWVDSDNNGAEVEVPEVTSLPSMFKTPVASKPNSPFKKKNLVVETEKEKIISEPISNEENFGEEKNVPDVTNLPSMFKTPVASKPNSPFKKKTAVIETDKEKIISEPISNEENFGEEKNVPDVTNLPAMFKNPVESKPNSPFKNKTVIKADQENTVDIVEPHSNVVENNQEKNNFIPKKKLSFGKR